MIHRGVHVATYLYASTEVLPAGRPAVRGAVLTQVPMHFHNAHGSRKATLDGYYSDYNKECPYALRQQSNDKTETCIVLAERDPDDEIVRPVSLAPQYYVQLLTCSAYRTMTSWLYGQTRWQQVSRDLRSYLKLRATTTLVCRCRFRSAIKRMHGRRRYCNG